MGRQRHRVTLLTLLRDAEQERHVRELNGLCEHVVTTLLSDDTVSVLRRLSAGLLQGRPLIQSMHYDRAMADHVSRLTSQNAYDIIHVEFSFMAPYLDSVSPHSQARRVLVMHNVESRRFRRELRFAKGARRLALLTDHLLFKRWEGSALRRFDGIVAVSQPSNSGSGSRPLARRSRCSQTASTLSSSRRRRLRAPAAPSSSPV